MSTSESPQKVANEASPETGLAKGRIKPAQAFFYALSALAIATFVTGIGATMVTVAGWGSWLVMLLGSIVALLLATIVSRFARRHLTTGSIMAYMDLEIGKKSGVLAGAALLVGYIAVMCLYFGLALVFLVSFFSSFGIDLSAPWLVSIIGVVLVIIAVALARRGVSLSVNTTVVLGWICVPVAIVILIAAVANFGVDFGSQFALKDFDPATLVPGFILGYGVFVGFEGFTALAQETADPRRTVPKLVFSTVAAVVAIAMVALLLTVPIFIAHYKEVLAGASPAHLLADVGGVSVLGTIADALLFLATFASMLAYVNDAGRIFGTAARDGMLPKALGKIHPKHRTPANAITFFGAAAAVVFIAYFLITQLPVYLVFINFALVVSYAWGVAYLSLSYAGVVDGIRTRKVLFMVGSIVAGLAVLFALVMSMVTGAVLVPIITFVLIAVLTVVGIIVRRDAKVSELTETL
ncbi:MAG TPA: APC family permease [Pseudolysinimonas sp.]|nr:APC family permease [Pseudolysinimonas sp.]